MALAVWQTPLFIGNVSFPKTHNKAFAPHHANHVPSFLALFFRCMYHLISRFKSRQSTKSVILPIMKPWRTVELRLPTVLVSFPSLRKHRNVEHCSFQNTFSVHHKPKTCFPISLLFLPPKRTKMTFSATDGNGTLFCISE